MEKAAVDGIALLICVLLYLWNDAESFKINNMYVFFKFSGKILLMCPQ